MNKPITILLVSLLIPGLGYLQTGDKKNFYKTVATFFAVFTFGITFRLFTSFTGLCFIIVTLLIIYLFAAVHSAIKPKSSSAKAHVPVRLKFFLTISFIFITGFSFANRRLVMGFDILSMDVQVMQPTVLQGDKFLADFWVYKNNKPERGDIVVHSFDKQKGLFLNRIIAKENDRVEIKNGIVVLNGQALTESYVLQANVTRPASKHMKELIVPKGHYFVMGDNRDASFGDSRFSGTIRFPNIAGKITDIISSRDQSRIGITVK